MCGQIESLQDNQVELGRATGLLKAGAPAFLLTLELYRALRLFHKLSTASLNAVTTLDIFPQSYTQPTPVPDRLRGF